MLLTTNGNLGTSLLVNMTDHLIFIDFFEHFLEILKIAMLTEIHAH